MVVTKHVKNVETITMQQNDHQLRAQHEEDIEGVREDLAPQETTQATVQSRERKYRTRTSGWAREAYGTRSTTKKIRDGSRRSTPLW